MPHERRHDTERLLGQVTMLTIVVVVAGLAAAAGGVTPAANHAGHGPGPSAQNVTTPCDGIDLDAIRRYKPRQPDGRARRVPSRLAQLSGPRLAPRDDGRLR